MTVHTPTVRLDRGRDRAVRLGHPWILCGSVEQVEGAPASGDAVRIASADGEILGFGDYDMDSQIRVRVHTRGSEAPGPDEPWVGARLEAAVRWRRSHPGLRNTDALRLVHGEADGLPGLTVDRYAHWLCIRLTSPGMQRRASRIARELAELTGTKGIWLRGEAGEQGQRLLYGEVPEESVPILERGRRYHVDIRRGQRTGFYLDQRDARDLFSSLAEHARVLDLFAYTGGFSLAALHGDAREVIAVESSKQALDLLCRNARGAIGIHADVSEFLRREPSRFDLIAVDPPPFARRRGDAMAAARAYKDLMMWVLRRAAPGAHVLTFSCSHHVSAELFRKVVFSAVADARAEAQVLGTLVAAPDHPVDLRHPEAEYLRGLWLRVAQPGG